MSEVGCLRGGHFQNLKVEGKTILGTTTTGLLYPKVNIITWSSAKTLLASETGSLIITGDTSAGILTLPVAATAGTGWYCDILINHAQASAATHISASANGVFEGGVLLVDKDTADKTLFVAPGGSDDWINLNAATKGNDPGGKIRIVCDGTNWFVSGVLVGDGSLATPFATD